MRPWLEIGVFGALPSDVKVEIVPGDERGQAVSVTIGSERAVITKKEAIELSKKLHEVATKIP